jgi:hypothetical protein
MNERKDLKDWLGANVQYHPEPKYVALSDFEVDWNDLSRSFILSLDLVKIEPRIKFSLDSNGWMRFWMPMHHSPLGVPASFAMFELTDTTNNAIERALKEVFGCFRPLGLNKDINQLITGSTPILDRVLEDNPLVLIRERLRSKNFLISMPVIV